MTPFASFLPFLLISMFVGPAIAQEAPCQPSWMPTFGTPAAIGVTGLTVTGLTVFDDGRGSGPALYVAGDFSEAGSVPAKNLAKWNGFSWSAVGGPLGIRAVAVFDDGNGPALYVAGKFTSAAPGVPANQIAKWDGTSWSALGSGITGGIQLVDSLAVFDDGSGAGPALYVGGQFTTAGGNPAASIAKWDGSRWSDVGGGMGAGAAVLAMTVFDDGNGGGPALYAGGWFPSAGGVPTNGIARWNGSSWSALGSGVSGGSPKPSISSLGFFDDGSGAGPALYAGGDFTAAGGVSASRIAKWDGSSWSPLGGGMSGGLVTGVSSLETFDDGSGAGPALYAGGDFTTAGGVQVGHVAKWDGSSWSALNGGFGTPADIPMVRALEVFDDGGGPALFAGGRFTIAGGVPAYHIAKWSGSTWSPLGNPQPHALNGSVHAMTLFDDGLGNGTALYAAGLFSTVGGMPARLIAKWDGTSWSPLGSGISHSGLALAVFDDGNGGGPALVAAGSGSSPNISMWDGSSWSGVGSGINVRVNALAVFDDGGGTDLYAGGFFSGAGGVSAPKIARWDGTSWSSVGGGMNDDVLALTIFDDGKGGGPALYAAGEFTFAGGVPANHIAKWDGESWSPLGSGVNSDVLALTVLDDGSGAGPSLYAGGNFTSAGGIDVNFIAKWDGSGWSALSGMNNAVRALSVFDDGSGPALFAGGDFTLAGGVEANRIAKWDGANWSPLGSGMGTGSVLAFAVFDDGSGAGPALFAGGSFTSSPSDDAYLAKWGCPSPPPFATFCTAKTALVCGPANISATGTPSATATSGFTIKAQPVRGCRAGLLLYSNQPPATGVPFGGPGDGALCLSGMGLKRAGPIQTGSMPQLCEATFAIDMNRFRAFNWTAGGCNPPPGQTNPAGFLGNMGTTINAQMWGRDSIATGQVLSDGISWSIGP